MYDIDWMLSIQSIICVDCEFQIKEMSDIEFDPIAQKIHWLLGLSGESTITQAIHAPPPTPNPPSHRPPPTPHTVNKYCLCIQKVGGVEKEKEEKKKSVADPHGSASRDRGQIWVENFQHFESQLGREGGGGTHQAVLLRYDQAWSLENVLISSLILYLYSILSLYKL